MSSITHADLCSLKPVLSPDILLKIAECLIEGDPSAILPLLLTSKNIYSLLKAYEKSITMSVYSRGFSLPYTKLTERTMLQSCTLAPDTLTVIRFTYAWFAEMCSRETTIEYLLSHELTEMLDDTGSGNWPTLDISKADLARRTRVFKKRALILMYQLSDCTVGASDTIIIRQQQSEFLEGLSAEDLAALACMGEVLGHGYTTMTKNVLARHEYRESLLCLHHCEPHRGVFIPNGVGTGDLDSDYWIRECMCVFEDKVQRYGPYFAWAFLDGCSMGNRRPDVWFREVMQAGLKDMNDFELGHTMAFASLQSVVWKVLCLKADCPHADRWTKVKELIESEMTGYKLPGLKDGEVLSV